MIRRLSIVLLALLCSCSKGSNTPTAPPGPGSGSNHAPTVNLNIDKTVLSSGQTATLTATTADADGDQVTLAWRAGRGTVQASGPTATTATYTAPNSFGTDSVVATASDGKGSSGQATAHVYVRNSQTPVFTLGATGSATCGYGTPTPDGFILTITPAEDVLVSDIFFEPRFCDNCLVSRHYATPLMLRAGVAFAWTDGACQTTTCCLSRGCGSCGFWSITIDGQRPAPDGGSFYFQCPSWSVGGSTCY